KDETPSRKKSKELEIMHPYLRSLQGNTIDELQEIYSQHRHEFDTNLANLSKEEQDELKMRIKLTQMQIEYRNEWKDKDGKLITDKSKLEDTWKITNTADILEKNNQQLLFRKNTTDIYKRDLKNGNITQKQYDQLVKEGKILSEKDYNKASNIRKQINDARSRPPPKPEYVPPKYKVKEQDIKTKHKAVDIDGNKIDYEHQINDIVITPAGTVGTIKKINGNFISIMDISGDTISTKLDIVKLVKRAPEKKKDEWQEKFNQEQNEIAEITKGNIGLIAKKSLTDRFRRSVKEGDLTQKQYDERVKSGQLLNDVQYKKVVEINKRVQAVKDKPFFEPDIMQKSKIKNAAESLKWEAAHPPKELQPPKEYTDAETKNFIWGLSENEAVDKLVAKERSDLVRWVDNQNKDEVRFKGLEKKWTALNRKEQKLPENQELRYQYHSLKKDVKKYSESAKWWQQKINKIDSGEYKKINKSSLHNKYVDQVKLAIKKGKPVPYNVIKQYPEFTKAQNSRERYNKGRHTSFANVSIAVDE
ncbi:MAG: hypothetical protein KAS04_05420, partial [Candidatus Aenigmarchaeota archaeon]|nr:hypothetical protein [Candidatus Aenigmarchaeota archaeon]